MSPAEGVVVDGGLVALATVLAMHRIVVDPAQLRHSLGHDDPVSTDDILRLCKRTESVPARLLDANWTKLHRLPLPALAQSHEGWFVTGRLADDVALIQRPGRG